MDGTDPCAGSGGHAELGQFSNQNHWVYLSAFERQAWLKLEAPQAKMLSL